MGFLNRQAGPASVRTSGDPETGKGTEWLILTHTKEEITQNKN